MKFEGLLSDNSLTCTNHATSACTVESMRDALKMLNEMCPPATTATRISVSPMVWQSLMRDKRMLESKLAESALIATPFVVVDHELSGLDYEVEFRDGHKELKSAAKGGGK